MRSPELDCTAVGVYKKGERGEERREQQEKTGLEEGMESRMQKDEK